MTSTIARLRDSASDEAFFLSEVFLNLKNGKGRKPKKSAAVKATEHLRFRLAHGNPVKGFVPGNRINNHTLGLAAAKASGEPILTRKGALLVPTSLNGERSNVT